MQLFIRGASSGTVALEASGDSSVESLKAAFTRRAYGAVVPEAVVLLYNSRQLGDGQRLADAGLVPGATLSACSRLRGGGGDGGSTGAESRSCYLEMYAEKKPDKVNPAEELLARATRCRLSGELLTPPCVADELGSLFNKEALVHALLNKTMPPALAHISLKALINLSLTPINQAQAAAGPGPGSSNGSNGNGTASAPHFQCPITGQEMNGRVPFVIHRPSGAVLSERALRDVPAAAEELLGGAWARADLIPVNPTGEELERRQQQLAAALAAERARKQAKKAGKRKDAAAAGAADGAAVAAAGAAGGGGEGGRAVGEAVGSKRGLPPAGPAPAAAGAGGPPAAAAAAAANGSSIPKKLKVPEGATPAIYASIFSTGKPKMKETYMCRSTSNRGLGM